MNDSFQALAVDNWNGSESGVDFYIAQSGVPFPVLMNGDSQDMEGNYNAPYHYYFVIDGDGYIAWRGNYNDSAIRGAIDTALANLGSSPVGDGPQTRRQLLNNYPNPFNPTTNIPFELSDTEGDALVRLEVLDLRGKVVRTLVDGQRAGGQRYDVSWDGTDLRGRMLPSGPYISRLTVDGKSESRLMTLVK